MNLRGMGKTIIISSHILSELSEMCTSIGIMNQGRLVAIGKIEDILHKGAADDTVILEIRKDMDRAVTIVKQMANVDLISVMENEIKIKYPGEDAELNKILIELMQQDVMLHGFHRQEGNLEQMFMQLTGSGEEAS